MSATPTKEGLMKWVDEYAVRKDLGAQETLFLTKFAAFADAAMEGWAAVKTLAERARCKERKAQYMLRDFEADGVIRRTGRLHRIPGTTRDVPIYVFCGYLEELKGEAAMGAQRAPMRGDGCTDAGGMGAQGVHPHNEPIELTLPDGSDAHARDAARESIYRDLEAAAPKSALGYTHPGRAREALAALLDEGLDPQDLIGCAKRWAADKAFKRRDLGLDHWLADRKFRAWWPEPQLAFVEAKPAAAVVPHAAPAEDQAIWLKVADQLAGGMTEATFNSWLRPAALCALDGQLYLVAATSMARDWLRNNATRRIYSAWAEQDRHRRALTIVSKVEFEGVQRRSLEGADT